MYYIKVFEKIENEYKYYGYFERLIVADIFQHKPEINISTVSNKQYAKKYKRKGWVKNKIQEIKSKTSNNIFCFDNNGNYIYKFKIVQE